MTLELDHQLGSHALRLQVNKVKYLTIIFIVIGCIVIAGIASGGEVDVSINVNVSWNGW